MIHHTVLTSSAPADLFEDIYEQNMVLKYWRQPVLISNVPQGPEEQISVSHVFK
jgi:hypothetical protein